MANGLEPNELGTNNIEISEKALQSASQEDSSDCAKRLVNARYTSTNIILHM